MGMFDNAGDWSKEQWQSVINQNPEAWAPQFSRPDVMAYALEQSLTPYETYNGGADQVENVGGGANPAYTMPNNSDRLSLSEQSDIRAGEAEQWWQDWYGATEGQDNLIHPRAQMYRLQVAAQNGDISQEEARRQAVAINRDVLGNKYNEWDGGQRYSFQFDPKNQGSNSIWDDIRTTGRYELDNPGDTVLDQVNNVMSSPVGMMLTGALTGGYGIAPQTTPSWSDAARFANDAVGSAERGDGQQTPGIGERLFSDYFQTY